MIPVNRPEILDAGLGLLASFGVTAEVRGRFVALYLGLRRMGEGLRGIGDATSTPSVEVETFLDAMYTKTHQPEPYVVLTAPFGGSTSPTAPYSTRSGVKAPGHKYPTNTWRNNLGIQKGIGCPASAEVILTILDSPAGRLACPHMSEDSEGRHLCGIAGTNYRGEEHSIWLRMAEGGYQGVDLNSEAVYHQYLNPGGKRIPIFPLIAVLYSFAPNGIYPERATVGIPDFATDFHFTLDQVQHLFDCEPGSTENSALLERVEYPAWGPVPPPAAGEAIPAGQMPEAPAGPLPIPPPATQINFGVFAELVVAGDLTKHGWDVAYRGNQPTLGYDLEARRGGDVLRVEVKSSVAFTYPELRESEWKAALKYGEAYVLAVVDFIRSEQQTIWYVRNPASGVVPVQKTEITYGFPRAELAALKTEADFL